MTTKTRYFMLGSAGILVLGLCTGLIAYYGGLPTGTFVQAQSGPAELRYLPTDCAVVAYANVREVMSSELRQRLRDHERETGSAGREEFQEQTGIDLENDVDEVVAGMLPREEESDSVVLVRGRFDPVRIEAFARSKGGQIEEYQGKRLITHQGEKGDMGLGFLEPGLLAVGNVVAIRRAIDTARAGSNLTTNADMMKLVQEIRGGNNAWAVGRFDVIANRARLPETVAAQIPPIQRFAAAGRVNGGLSGVFRAEARDEQSATNLRDVARGFLALARLQVGSKPELQGMLDSLELSGTGNFVTLTFTIPMQVFDAIAPRRAQ